MIISKIVVVFLFDPVFLLVQGDFTQNSGFKQPSSIFEFYDEQSIASILQDPFAIINHRIIDVIDP